MESCSSSLWGGDGESDVASAFAFSSGEVGSSGGVSFSFFDVEPRFLDEPAVLDLVLEADAEDSGGETFFFDLLDFRLEEELEAVFSSPRGVALPGGEGILNDGLVLVARLTDLEVRVIVLGSSWVFGFGFDNFARFAFGLEMSSRLASRFSFP